MKRPPISTARIRPAAVEMQRGKSLLVKSWHLSKLVLPRHAAPAADQSVNLAALFRQTEERVLGQVIAAAHEPNAAAIHDLRVTLRRFAELLQTARIASLLPDGKGRRLLRRIRAIRRLGGDVRDIDVLVELLCTPANAGHRSHQATRPTASDQRSLKLLQKRQSLVKKLQTELRKLISSGLLTLLARRLAMTGSQAPGQPAIGHIWRRVQVNRRNLAIACQVALTEGSDSLIHRARIAAKKMRYSCELAAQAGWPDLQAVLRQIKKFQKITGDLHDTHLAMEFFASGATKRSDTPPDTVPRRIAARHSRLHAAALKQLAQWLSGPAILTAASPKRTVLSILPSGRERGIK